jgi:preprotein translocase subunit Sss1
MTDLDPSQDEFKRRRKANARVVGLILLGLVALIYAITIARMGTAGAGK